MASYLILLAGTERQHRFSSWSVNSIWKTTGMNKERIKKLIRRLKKEGLIVAEPPALPKRYCYELAAFEETADAIFLPTELVRGTADETPILRRLREAQHPFALMLLIDLYGWVSTEMAYAVRPDLACTISSEPAWQEVEVGAIGVWALPAPDKPIWNIDLSRYAPKKDANLDAKQRAFRECLQLLKNMGAVVDQPWVCSLSDEPEPLFPWSEHLAALADDAARRLMNRVWPGRAGTLPYVPLPAHMKSATLARLVKLRIEPDTEARRAAFARRREVEASLAYQFEALAARIDQGDFTTPIRTLPPR